MEGAGKLANHDGLPIRIKLRSVHIWPPINMTDINEVLLPGDDGPAVLIIMIWTCYNSRCNVQVTLYLTNK